MVADLQQIYVSKEPKIGYVNIPSNISEEIDRFVAREIEYSELSMEAQMQVISESIKERRKDPIRYSELPKLLDYETWSPKDAMLILAGIDPFAAIMKWSYENFMGAEIRNPKIIHANWFASTSDLYDYPVAADEEVSSSEVRQMIREGEKLSPNSPEIKNRIERLKKRLIEVERWEKDETSVFKSSMLKLRAKMAGILNARWETGGHDVEARRSPKFFLQWAESRGFKVEWAAWARAEGFIDSDAPATAAPFFDSDAEDYPRLLHIAVRAWDEARKGGQGTASQRITAFLQDRYPELSSNEKESIRMICNWQKAGGRPPKIGG